VTAYIYVGSTIDGHTQEAAFVRHQKSGKETHSCLGFWLRQDVVSRAKEAAKRLVSGDIDRDATVSYKLRDLQVLLAAPHHSFLHDCIICSTCVFRFYMLLCNRVPACTCAGFRVTVDMQLVLYKYTNIHLRVIDCHLSMLLCHQRLSRCSLDILIRAYLSMHLPGKVPGWKPRAWLVHSIVCLHHFISEIPCLCMSHMADPVCAYAQVRLCELITTAESHLHPLGGHHSADGDGDEADAAFKRSLSSPSAPPSRIPKASDGALPPKVCTSQGSPFCCCWAYQLCEVLMHGLVRAHQGLHGQEDTGMEVIYCTDF
jgi:hypothetical protein